MSKGTAILLLILLSTLLPVQARAVPYPVVDGFKIESLVPVGAEIRAVAVQPWDGKIIVGGVFDVTRSDGVVQKNLARFHTDGKLDEDFATSAEGLNAAVNSIVIQADPSSPNVPQASFILVGGSFPNISFANAGWPLGREVRIQNGLVRLKSADGKPDDFAPAAQLGTIVNAIAVQSDIGRIVVGGAFTQMAGANCRNIARIDATTGAYRDNLSNGLDGEVSAILVQAGKIVVGGNFSAAPWQYLARFLQNGDHDLDFSVVPDAAVRSLVLQPDGKIIAGGDFTKLITSVYPAGISRKHLARISDSAVDDFDPSVEGGAVSAILQQPDGKILIAGSFTQILNSSGLAGAGPGGGFLPTGPPVLRNRVARLNLDGTLDPAVDPNPDDIVQALALQPDGKFLIGGKFANAGGQNRLRLARFDAWGTLDQDVSSFGPTLRIYTDPTDTVGSSLLEGGTVKSVSLQPNGMMTIAGEFTNAGPDTLMRWGIARVKPNWSLVSDLDMDPDLIMDNSIFALAPHPDGRMAAGGLVRDDASNVWRTFRLDAAGRLDAAFDSNIALNLRPAGLNEGDALLLAPSADPPPAPQPDLKLLVGGHSPAHQFFLAKVDSAGLPDGGFDSTGVSAALLGLTPSVTDTGWVSAIAQLPDYKLIVGTSNGYVMRLKANGALDTDFPVTSLGGMVYSIALLAKPVTAGDPNYPQFMVAGVFNKPITVGGTTWRRSILRFNNDGSIDDSFKFGTDGFLNGAELLADGSILIQGVFDNVTDVTGSSVPRHSVARLNFAGEVDTAFDFGFFQSQVGLPQYNVITLAIQPDGKVVAAGGFISIDGEVKKNLARLTNRGMWATQDLSVSADGQKVTWLRGGGGPELWRVSLEQSNDGQTWTYLGEAARIPAGGGWYKEGLNLGGGFGFSKNGYVRARGYTSPQRGGSVSLLESVKLYYLQPQAQTAITVVAAAQGKSYNGNNLASVTLTPQNVAPGDVVTLTCSNATFSDKAVGIGKTVTVTGISIGGADAAKYTLPVTTATAFADITHAPLTITAAAANKDYGTVATLPGTAFALSGLIAGDSVTSVTLTSAGVAATAAVGGYAITPSAAVGTGLDNYTISYQNGTLAVKPIALSVTAAAKSKTYGAADPLLTYSAAGFVNGETSAILTGSLSRTAGENVGPHAINLGTLAAGANYSIAFSGADLTIGTAQLTITAQNKSKLLGDPNPALTASFDGLASWDTPASLGGAPLLTTVADIGSPTGSYPIVASIGSIVSTNYSYLFLPGVLVVTGSSPQAITFDAMRPKTLGDADFDPGATASSGLSVSYSSATAGVASVVGGRLRVLAPGTTEITASQAGDATYQAAPPKVQTLKVNPPPWNGLRFDGIDDLMRVADGPQLSFASKAGFSIETWLQLDGSQPDGAGLLAKAGSGGAWSGYQLILQQNRIAAQVGDGVVSFGAPQGLIGSSDLNDGQWHHVAFSVDRSLAEASLYVDGRLETRVAHAVFASNLDTAEPVLVGTDRSGLRFFKGKLDELRIWAAARSKEELRLAASQIIDPLGEQHLAAYFHFDEGDAGLNNAAFATAPERTANHGNGALQGFALTGSSSNWVASGAFLPLLETTRVSAVVAGSATVEGLVYANYFPPSEVGLCWGALVNPGFADNCSRSGGVIGAFAGIMTGLTPGATYHVRAFATNHMGTAFGNDLSLQTSVLEQTISFAIDDKTYGDPGFKLGGSAGSGLALSYVSSNPDVAVVVNDELRITGAGSTVITASQAGNATYGPAAQVARTLTVRKKELVVTAEDKARAYQAPNPTLTVSYQGFAPGESSAVIQGAPLLSTDATQTSPTGSYRILASPGTLAAQNYSFTLRNGTLNVFRSCQQIIFPPIGDRTFGDPPVQLSASSCSGLGITFTGSNPQVAQISGNQLAITGAGTVVVTASQGGSNNLEQAAEVSQTVVVNKSGQVLNFAPLEPKALGDPAFSLNAGASSGLPVSYLSSDPGVATVSGNLLTIVGAGTTVITALQSGNANFEPALAVSEPLAVFLEGKAPLLTLSTLSSGDVTVDPVLNVTGTASDASGIASLTVNDADLTHSAELFSSAVALGSGGNSITVTAKDGAGNKSSKTLSIVLDTAGPAIALSRPADNSVTDASYFTATGTVTPGSAVTMRINGGSATSLPVAEGGFTGGGYLQDGINTVEFTAAISGRSSKVKRTVTYAAGKPYLAITEPVEDIRTEQAALVLSGVAGAQGGEVAVTVDADGAIFTPIVKAGGFQQTLTLKRSGQIQITASATDSGGNVSVAHRNIIKVDKVLGDLNGDGRADLQDALALLRISLGLDPLTSQALAHGDVAPLVDGVPQPDGRIDVGDVLVLLRKIVGLVNF